MTGNTGVITVILMTAFVILQAGNLKNLGWPVISSPLSLWWWCCLIALQWCVSSTIQQSESTVHIHPLFFGFPSHLGHHRVLSGVPGAI